jgi:hypothetical protein
LIKLDVDAVVLPTTEKYCGDSGGMCNFDLKIFSYQYCLMHIISKRRISID